MFLIRGVSNMSLRSVQILPNLSKSMLLAWFQSELVPVALHNSKITQVILSPSTVELVNWIAASSSWAVLERGGGAVLRHVANRGCCIKRHAGRRDQCEPLISQAWRQLYPTAMSGIPLIAVSYYCDSATIYHIT